MLVVNVRKIEVIMKKTLNYADAISTLLAQKGVGDRKHASTMASILNLQYNSAKQKLDGKRGITLDEIKKIFQYFNESFGGRRAHNCVFIMNNIHKRCNIEVDDKPVDHIEDTETYAFRKNDLFIINTDRDKSVGAELYKVRKIDFLPTPRIAILDNDQDILELLKKITTRYGIETDTFPTATAIIDGLEQHTYEAFILDWLLDFGETSEKVVEKIKDLMLPPAQIIILTGQLNHYEKNIGDMILNYDVHLVEKPAKPLIISSLLLSHLFFN
ncbi:BetR domain protein [Serratia sp. AS12]|uniref:helix-turn-helix domain-containing protein n=1 Tax=Serratia TaxID=613 RepID=UPI00020E96AB|nr:MULTISPECIES: helix-turn-helix domain-containing protein [Serratia]AEF43401.1 BetR domain protein [Serratia plymuthica AS9]AEF48353.1 BetR domain protein [Serratia sp. AS12]AEG26061.1 BetR domain protein [Serratia sp. AS13]UTN96968.1 helix-turn-helix domain-containing protein [Serratia plymuthica]